LAGASHVDDVHAATDYGKQCAINLSAVRFEKHLADLTFVVGFWRQGMI
jgi:hypothetical protein